MTTTYLASTARATITDALDTINTHAALSHTGLCRTCHSEGPCHQRLAAERALHSRGLLPQRRPGATRPDLIGLRRVGTTWLTPATGRTEGRHAATSDHPPIPT